MTHHELDLYGFSNEDGDGCMAVFVDFPEIKGIGDTFEEARDDAYERLEEHKRREEKMMTTFDKAIAAYEAKQYSEAYRLFEDDATDNPQAMVNLALMRMKGNGCEKDDSEALTWFEAAAALDNSHALHSLGLYYEKGMGGDIDLEKANDYFKRAADLGQVEAQVKAGMAFRQEGKMADAMRYLITAAHNNDSQAQEIITYVSNAGVETVINEPFRLLDDARQIALVQDMIEKKVRPTLAVDGGGIELVNYIPGETPQLWLNYLGACSGCHLGSTSTADMLLDHFETLIDKNVILYLM